MPTTPAKGASALAQQVAAAESVLGATHAPPADVQQAAEFQQLAVRQIANRPSAFGAKVLEQLDEEAARATRDNVFAAKELLTLTAAQPALPKWRIVRPPSAGKLLAHYRATEKATGVPWAYLAAIHLVETRMGRIRGTSTAGAQGPMQFMPATWDAYGNGGDINDPGDAILAAGRLLKDNGAPRDMAGALWNYNHANAYVRAVTTYARAMEHSEASYRTYWHWRVLYRHQQGTFVLPVGYPKKPAVLLPPAG